MVVPPPPFKLEGHCSVVENNTLYVFSPHGFASLPLQRNATWITLAMGEAVSDAVCVRGGVNGDNNQAALYVVGGKSSNSNYPGLQRYTFSTNSWSTLAPVEFKTQNLTRHGAVYLNATSSILVYAGSQDGNTYASTTTYVISTQPPFRVSADTSHGAPPALSPTLVQWNANEAALVSGFTTTNQIYLFNAENGWQNSGVVLSNPPSTNAKCALITGSDGSKVLETFHLDVSPNSVDSVALLISGGLPANPAPPVGVSSVNRLKQRDFTLNSFPAYNGTFAPVSKWTSYSLAHGQDLVVLSSGSGSDSIAVFNQSANGWMNTTKLFYGNHPVPSTLAAATPSSSATSVASAGPNSNSSTAGIPSGSSSINTGTIIAATLGSVLGVVAIVILLLMLVRRQNQGRTHGRSRSLKRNDGRLSFQDQGIESLAKSAYPMAKSPVPRVADTEILTGGKGRTDEKSLNLPLPSYIQQGHMPISRPLGTSLSTIQSSGVGETARITPSSEYDSSSAAAAAAAKGGAAAGPPRPGDRRTDEGWSRYFQNNSATDLASMQAARDADADTAGSDASRPDLHGTGWPITRLAPLNFGFLDEPKPLGGRVASASPTTTSPYSDKDGRSLVIPESQSARISNVSSISFCSDDGGGHRQSGAPTSDDNDSNWLAVREQSWLGRPPSSTYSDGSNGKRDTRRVASMADSFDSEYEPLDATAAAAPSSFGRGSSVVIPEDLNEPPPPPRTHNINSNMSWLNINANR